MKLTKTKSRFHRGKKSINLKSYQYKLDIYSVDITIILGDKNIKKYYKLNNNTDLRSGLVISHLESSARIIILLKDGASMNVVAHECTHCANFIFDYIGYEYQIDGDEVNAYLVGHLVDVVLKAKKIKGLND